MTHLDAVIALAREAGAAILDVYLREDLGESRKDDASPLTEADLAAHHMLVDGLGRLTPGVPILSEESVQPSWAALVSRQRLQFHRVALIFAEEGAELG